LDIKPNRVSVDKHIILQREENQLFSQIDNEIVLLSVKNGEYYSLNEIGSAIWEMLTKPMSVERLINNLTENYEIEYLDCYMDTIPFIEDLLEKGVIKIQDE